MTEVLRHVSRGFSCNSYLCRDTESGKCLLIDPGVSAEEMLAFVGETRPEKIVLTHAHFDHVIAAPALREAWGVPIAVHRLDAELLEDPDKNASSFLRRAAVCFSADECLEEGDVLRFGDQSLSVLHTPGHTPGGLCLLGEGHLFCGDTLFSDGVGRTDLYGGDFSALQHSVSRLFSLKEDYTVHAGHGEDFPLSVRIAQNELF